MPFPFYNTAAPTPSTKNNITDIAVTYGIRDFLLNKNLAPVYPYLSTAINGSPRIGEPVLDLSVNGDVNVIPLGLPLEVEGILRYETAIASNQFKNDQPTAPSLIDIENITQTQGVFGSVDFPDGTQSYPTSSSESVAKYGLLGKTDYAGFRKSATLLNLYLDTTKQFDAADFITLQPAGFTQQITGYADQYGGLNLGNGQKGVQAANIIGSLLNGQGLGLAKGGVVTNFDIKSSLAGRVLSATGAINDTKLGMIGGQQLVLALANNAAFNVQQDILGSLNIQDNVLALVKGGPLPGLRPNYQITVPSSTLGKIADYTEKVLGFTIPRSYLQDAGSIFSSENQSGNIQRANSMLENTGKGQRQSLTDNMFANINGTGEYDKPSTTAFRSGYVPGHAKGDSEPDLNPSLYSFYDDETKGTILNLMAHSDNLIPEISYDRSNMIKKYGFFAPEDTGTGPNGNTGYDKRKYTDVGFTWTSTNGEAVNSEVTSNSIAFPDELPSTVTFDGVEHNQKKSLLYKTQQLFNSKGMLNIVTAKGDMNKISSQIETANGGGFSKGSAVLKGDVYSGGYQVSGKFDAAENTYCRSWTTVDRYDKVYNLIRNSGLEEFSKVLPYRFKYDNSTLESNGFVKIAPYVDEYDELSPITTNPKNYMFSIENLAWHNEQVNLLPVEQGPGDTTTGKRGRIMWFPPYNIQFSESTSVNWEPTNFIGRGEPVYTYNNTERTGNLSFTIVVDHSSYVNGFGDSAIQADDNYVASFFAGCVQPDSKIAERLTLSQKSYGAQASNQTVTNKNVEAPKLPEPFNVYFPNDIFDINTVINLGYENGLNNDYNVTPPIVGTTPVTSLDGAGNGIGKLQGVVTPPKDSNGKPMINAPKKIYFDGYNYGKNAKKLKVIAGQQEYSGITDDAYFSDLSNYLKNTCKACVIKIQGTASPQGYEPYNTELAEQRAKSVAKFLEGKLTVDKSRIKALLKFKALTNTGCKIPGKPDQETCKEDRRAEVTFEIDPSLYPKDVVEAPAVVKNENQNLNKEVKNQLYDESRYFNRLKYDSPLVFDAFKDKINHFNPAFHSMTPEGLNSRLTFLQQCTRQGPTLEKVDTKNLAFGRAPVCILRIGDFYHTKIVIDSLNIDYEPLIWDLNPEGIGVQPMLANVTLTFKFVGGSSLQGPINILQNALSFNYYANTQVYDPRASYIEEGKVVVGATTLTSYTATDNQTETTNKEINQGKNAEIATDANSAQVATVNDSTTPAITGFESVEINGWVDNPNAYTVKVKLSQTGLFKDENGLHNQLVTEDELKAFMSKGVKLTLDVSPTPTSASRVEEVITDANITRSDSKSTSFLFGLGYFMGDDTSGGSFRVKFLLSGNYVLQAFYDGKNVAKLAVTVGDKFQYFG